MSTLQLKLSVLSVVEFVTTLETKGLSRTPSRNFLNHFFYRNDSFMVYYDSDSNLFEIFISKPNRDKSADTRYVCNRNKPSYVETEDGLYVQIGEMSNATGHLISLHTREMLKFESWLLK